jgi:adenine-specific DNA-methyltransferase
MKEAVARRRALRRNATDAERELWKYLRDRRLGGFKFKRQRSVPPYFVDFYCAEKRIGVELDGGGHFHPDKQARDAQRTEYLNRLGVTVLRFTNREIFTELEAVLERIFLIVRSNPSPRPSPRGGRGGALTHVMSASS